MTATSLGAAIKNELITTTVRAEDVLLWSDHHIVQACKPDPYHQHANLQA